MAPLSRARPRSAARHRFLAAMFCVAVAAVSAPMRATAPQNPDGAELVLLAAHGGVPHPPGFPLQAWVDRLAVSALGGSPVATLDGLSLAAFTASLFVLFELCAALGASLAGSLVGVSCFAFFPSVWTMGVQPEKYALTGLLLALVGLASTRLAQRKAPFDWRHALGYGALCGLSFGQHVATAFLAPAAALVLVRAPRRRLALLVPAALLGFVAVAGGLYLSLFALTRPELWPDWGKLRTLSELVHHVFLANPLYRLTVAATPGLHGITVLAGRSLHALGPLLLLVPLGLWRARRLETRATLLVAWGGSLLLALLFLAFSRSVGEELIQRAYLDRYLVFALVLAVPFFALGADALLARLRLRGRHLYYWRLALTAAISLALLAHNRGASDVSSDTTLDVYREALGANLDPRAFYFGGSDLEGLYGAKLPDGGVRFPIVTDHDWYLERVMPLIEPRLEFHGAYRPSKAEIAQRAFAQGFPIYTTVRPFLNELKLPSQQRGLFWVADSKVHAWTGSESITAAIKLCDVLERRVVAYPGHSAYYAAVLWSEFEYALFPAIAELSRRGLNADAKLFERVAIRLRDPAGNVAALKQACADVAAHYRGRP